MSDEGDVKGQVGVIGKVDGDERPNSGADTVEPTGADQTRLKTIEIQKPKRRRTRDGWERKIE